ncbi:MAG: hypothetical protein ABFR97_10655 [Thermodesulfobacteriota bacterium]
MMPEQDKSSSKEYWRQRLLAMNRAARRRDLALHLGTPQPAGDDTQLLTIAELQAIKRVEGGQANKIFHQAADHFLRARVEPAQAILTTWMNGAKVELNGDKIPFNQVVSLCQDSHESEDRNQLTREVRALCRFLTPFNQATWQTMLECLQDDLAYQDYISFCEEKRSCSLLQAAAAARSFLAQTRETYQRLLPPLLREITGLSMAKASRFDGIYLMGLRYLDHLFPQDFAIDDLLDFLHKVGHTLVKDQSRLIIHEHESPASHPYCVPVAIPDEIHIIVGPIRGWLDLEGLCHELGHALSFLYSDPARPAEELDFSLAAGGTAESFAFLLQKMALDEGFLREVMALDAASAALVAATHRLKWLTLARRYGAKLVLEVENFQQGRLSEGEEHYAATMAQETGFTYGPETYLFDLMPDFYSFDYFQAFLTAAALEDILQEKFGPGWFQSRAAASCLQNWWHQGLGLDLFSKAKGTQQELLKIFIKDYKVA